MRRLQAGSLVLEPLTVAHAPEMFRVLGDPAIYEFENAPPVSEAWLAQRYARLERRGPADGAETWLNWVVRLSGGEPAGYVQATLSGDGRAHVAYELASRHWRLGIGTAAVGAMLAELRTRHRVVLFIAVLKALNHRSLGLLRKLGFAAAGREQLAAIDAEPDENVMTRAAESAPHAG